MLNLLSRPGAPSTAASTGKYRLRNSFPDPWLGGGRWETQHTCSRTYTLEHGAPPPLPPSRTHHPPALPAGVRAQVAPSILLAHILPSIIQRLCNYITLGSSEVRPMSVSPEPHRERRGPGGKGGTSVSACWDCHPAPPQPSIYPSGLSFLICEKG